MNALYEALESSSATAAEGTKRDVQKHWEVIRQNTHVGYSPHLIIAVMLYNGHMQLISQTEWDQLVTLATKATQALKQRDTPPAIVKHLYAGMICADNL